MSGHDVIRNIIFSGICGAVMTVTVAKHYKESTNWGAGISIAVIIFLIQSALDSMIP